MQDSPTRAYARWFLADRELRAEEWKLDQLRRLAVPSELIERQLIEVTRLRQRSSALLTLSVAAVEAYRSPASF